MTAIGKTSSEVKNRWNAKHYKRLTISLPKEDAEAYRKKCEKEGITQSHILKEAVYKFLGDK